MTNLVEPDWLIVPILSLLFQCLGSVGAQGDTFAHPDNDVALAPGCAHGFFGMQPSKAVSMTASRFMPAARYPALRTAANWARSSIHRS